MSRYLLVKAYVGFADRLQCLSHAIQYAEKYNRTVCVDWTDSIWSDGKIDFHTYFDLVGVPTISREELLAKFEAPLVAPTSDVAYTRREAGQVTKIHPLAWANQLDRQAHNKFIYKEPYFLPLNDEDHPADLLVYSSTGFRNFYTTNICQLRVKRLYRNQIVERLQRFKDYSNVVHLRGTDRTPPEKYEEYVEAMCEQMRMVENGLPGASLQDSGQLKQDGRESFVTSNEPILVVTDCLPLFQVFQKRFPNAVLRTPQLETYVTSVGTHFQLNDKHAHNLEMLIDFFVCAYARNCYHDASSLFAKMARFLTQGNYCDILGYDG